MVCCTHGGHIMELAQLREDIYHGNMPVCKCKMVIGLY